MFFHIKIVKLTFVKLIFIAQMFTYMYFAKYVNEQTKRSKKCPKNPLKNIRKVLQVRLAVDGRRTK